MIEPEAKGTTAPGMTAPTADFGPSGPEVIARRPAWAELVETEAVPTGGEVAAGTTAADPTADAGPSGAEVAVRTTSARFTVDKELAPAGEHDCWEEPVETEATPPGSEVAAVTTAASDVVKDTRRAVETKVSCYELGPGIRRRTLPCSVDRF